MQLNMKFKVSKQKRCVMRNVLHVPKLACNLFSVRDISVKFGKQCWIKDSKGSLIGMGSLES